MNHEERSVLLQILVDAAGPTIANEPGRAKGIADGINTFLNAVCPPPPMPTTQAEEVLGAGAVAPAGDPSPPKRRWPFPHD